MITRILLLATALLCGCGSPAPAAILVQSATGTYAVKTTLAAAAIAPDAAGKTVVITTDQTLTANLNWPADRTLTRVGTAKINHGAYTITYPGSTAGWGMAQMFNGTGLVTLNNAERIYTEWYGSKRDGVTDDTVAIQRAIDSASAVYIAGGKPRSLHFVGGGAYVVKQVLIKPGINLIGDGAATFLKLPAGAITDETVLKWWRMFYTDSSAFASDAACAHRIVISGLIFDGNLSNMNWTNNSYNQEQACCMILQGAAAPTHIDQRAKFRVSDCKFQNSVADGLFLYINADLIADNIEADNCFRGGFIATGGNSHLKLRGYVGENARIDFEVDGPGYGGTYDTNFDVSDITIDKLGGGIRPGGIDIGSYPGSNSRLTASNLRVFTTPLNIGAGGLKGTEIFHSYLTSGAFSTSIGGNRLVYGVGRVLFKDTVFHVSNDNPDSTKFAGLYLPLESASPVSGVGGKKITFENCSFTYDPAIIGKEIYGVVLAPSLTSLGNSAEMINCNVPTGFTAAGYAEGGGTILWRGGYTDATTAFYLDYSGTTRYFTLDVRDIEVGPNTTRWLGTNSVIGATGNKVKYRNVTIPMTASSTTTRAGAVAGEIANRDGHRAFFGTAAPVSGSWSLNDRIKYSTATAGGTEGLVCTTAGQAVKGAWTTGVAYVTGDYVSNASKLYLATTSGTAGATAPTHTTGTVSDGAVSWSYVSAYTATVFKSFGVVAP